MSGFGVFSLIIKMPTQVIQRIQELTDQENDTDTSGYEHVLLLREYLPYQLAVASNQVSRMVARRYHSISGLSIWEWRVIAVLAEGKPLAAQELSGAAAMDKVAVSRAVKALLERDLISRERHASDGRSSLLRLTSAGRATYQQVAPVALEAERLLVDGMSADEMRLLSGLLDRLREKAGAIDPS
jgi:DNA-binding MarR family transcriptional regulator